MSIPPIQPPNQNEPTPGSWPSAPQYGEQTPQYGQQAPQYGQQTPQYGQQPYGQSLYAQDPLGDGQNPEPVGIPKLVNIAFWLILGAGVVWVLSLLLSIPQLDDPEMRKVFEEQMATTGADINFADIKGGLIGMVVVFSIVGAGLYLLVAFNIRKGKNWARILGTVLAALSLLMLGQLGLTMLAIAVGIAAIVLLYLPASAPYFRKQPQFGNPYSR